MTINFMLCFYNNKNQVTPSLIPSHIFSSTVHNERHRRDDVSRHSLVLRRRARRQHPPTHPEALPSRTQPTPPGPDQRDAVHTTAG